SRRGSAARATTSPYRTNVRYVKAVRLVPHGTEVQKRRDQAPPSHSRIVTNVVIVGNGFTQRLDREPGVLQRVDVRFERTVHLVERHREPLPLDPLNERPRLQV